MVVNAYNPSYSGGNERMNMSLKPAQVKVVRPCLKNKFFFKTRERKGLRAELSTRILA
jgi:hypothetical protein